jgi:hypothetical protein
MHAIYVLAQAAAAAVPAAVPVQPQGVISYPASFFADKQVANAYEMLNRIPGFSLDTGDSVRGFEGAAGNVLIDGQRPTSWSASTSSAAARPASTCRARACWPT